MKKQSIISYYFKWRNQDDKLPKKRYSKEKLSSKLCNLPYPFRKKT